jgi:hypothetical protein
MQGRFPFVVVSGDTEERGRTAEKAVFSGDF